MTPLQRTLVILSKIVLCAYSFLHAVLAAANVRLDMYSEREMQEPTANLRPLEAELVSALNNLAMLLSAIVSAATTVTSHVDLVVVSPCWKHKVHWQLDDFRYFRSTKLADSISSISEASFKHAGRAVLS
eukprot:12121-Heterococcus_DN1.PRE.4